MTNHYIELELFRTTIQKLTFAYALPLTTLYEFSFRLKRPHNADVEGLPPDENTNGFKRYGRLFEKVCTETYSKNTPTFLITKPKIYDTFLEDSQKKIYNASSDVIGYKPITKVLSNSLIKSATFLDKDTPDYDAIAKEYPYYIPDKRNGVNFLEFILLLNFDLVINKRGLKTLNNPIVDENSEKLAKKMYYKTIKNMRTAEMFEMYARAFFDVFDEVVYKLHNPIAEQNIREIWLAEHYLQRKDVFRAVITHAENKLNLKGDEYQRTQVDNIIAKGNIYEIMKMDNNLENYNVLIYLELIFDMAFQILFKYEEVEEFKGSKEYILAEEYAKVIKEYIYNSMNEVETILRYLYIDDNSPLRQ